MVIKGSARGGAGELAVHLQRVDTNERVEVVELRDVAATDLEGALREIEAVGSGARSKRPFYHASINTPAGERLTDEQRAQSIDALEKALGLEDQPRIVVAHRKKDRDHVHVVWSRIDLEHMTAIPDSHNFRRHEEVSRQLEREFGHQHVQGAHIDREGVARPTRTPSHAEMQQAERTGLNPHQAKAYITGIWNRTDNGKAFAAALENEGWVLARGDRRDFVILDPVGETHGLARRIDGAKAVDIRARLADIDAATLPSVDEARAIQDQRTQARAAIHEQIVAADIPDAEARYKKLRGQHYDSTNPYASLAEAAKAEFDAFARDRQELEERIAKADDPRERQALELRKEIEAADYMAITNRRIAGQHKFVGGPDSPEAERVNTQADEYEARSKALRQELRDTVQPKELTPEQRREQRLALLREATEHRPADEPKRGPRDVDRER